MSPSPPTPLLTASLPLAPEPLQFEQLAFESLQPGRTVAGLNVGNSMESSSSQLAIASLPLTFEPLQFEHQCRPFYVAGFNVDNVAQAPIAALARKNGAGFNGRRWVLDGGGGTGAAGRAPAGRAGAALRRHQRTRGWVHLGKRAEGNFFEGGVLSERWCTDAAGAAAVGAHTHRTAQGGAMPLCASMPTAGAAAVTVPPLRRPAAPHAPGQGLYVSGGGPAGALAHHPQLPHTACCGPHSPLPLPLAPTLPSCRLVRDLLNRAAAAGLNVMRTWAHTSDPAFPFQVPQQGGFFAIIATLQ